MSHFIPETNVIDLGNYVLETRRSHAGPATWKLFHNGRKVGVGNGSTIRDAERQAMDYLRAHQMASL